MAYKRPTKALLKKLYETCTHKHTYSLPGALASCGISQEAAMEWFMRDPAFNAILSTCHDACFANIDIAELKFIIPGQEAEQYNQDNDSLLNAISNNSNVKF